MHLVLYKFVAYNDYTVLIAKELTMSNKPLKIDTKKPKITDFYKTESKNDSISLTIHYLDGIMWFIIKDRSLHRTTYATN